MNSNITSITSGLPDPVTRERAEQRKLASLLEISQALADTNNLKGALGETLETLAHHHGMVRSFVMLLDADTDKMRTEASFGLNGDNARRVSYRIGEGIVGRVVQSGKPIIVPQTSREAMLLNRLSGPERNSSPHELTFICVPIMINRKPIGVLGIDLKYKEERDYDRAIKFLSTVASLIAQALKVEHLVEADKQRLLDENIHLKLELRERYDFSHIIGNSSPLRQVYEQVAQVARTNATVLLRGESGTGKELIAHAIHYNSLRASKPFIKVSAAALRKP
jgi:Nif-specific regulatory protein